MFTHKLNIDICDIDRVYLPTQRFLCIDAGLDCDHKWGGVQTPVPVQKWFLASELNDNGFLYLFSQTISLMLSVPL